jgi:hypothetical protein
MPILVQKSIINIFITFIMKLINLLFILSFFFSLSNCGGFSKVDTRKNPVNVNDRAERNIQEGRGFKLGNLNKNNGVFDFATSNELWRASIDLLDFTPLSNVDYSGGIIITDWFSDNEKKNDYLKITIRFLSNEIRADGIKITIHEKKCTDNNVCKIKKIDSDLPQKIKREILREATLIKENETTVDKNYKISGRND